MSSVEDAPHVARFYGVAAVSQPARPQRILVYGVTGSGKTTAAERIAACTGLPLILVDDLMWQPGWRPVEAQRQRQMVTDVVAVDRWVLDSAYGAWLDLVLPRAELVIGLDYPRWLSLARLMRRSLMRLLDRRTICNGNRETLQQLVSRDSILVWHFRSFPRKRLRLRAWAGSDDGPPVLRLTSPAALEAVISQLGDGADPRER